MDGSSSRRRRLSLCWIILISASSYAQTNRTITVRMLDSKTGQPITTSEIEIHARMSPASAEKAGISVYVRSNQDGVGEATFPMAASDIRVYARDGVWGYVNCDCVKDRGSHQEHWYSLPGVSSSGVAAPNLCNKRKVIARPGEFIFFVRSMTFWEKMRE
jgi:hypothetical protein